MFEDPWPADRPLLKTIAGFSIPVLLVGALGYRYLTTATPVSADQAVEMFRAGVEVTSTDAAPVPSRKWSTKARPQPSGRERARPQRRAPSSSDPAPVVQAAEPSRDRSQPSHAPRPHHQRAPATFQPGAPEEGVYSWDTEGFESFNGSRRTFPAETQRIVTRH